MANQESINEFVSQTALKQLDDLKAKIDASAKSMEVLIQQTEQYNVELSKATTLKEFVKSVEQAKGGAAQLSVEQKALIKNAQDYQNMLVKLTAAQADDAKVIAEQKAQLAALNATTKEAIKIKSEEGNAYAQLVRKTKEAEQSYLKLAAAQGINSKAAQDAQKAHKALFTELSTIEQGAGNFRRQVGNYEKGFHSFTQVLREAPAFAINFQTGILALSNNIPLFVEELQRASKAGAGFGSIMKGLGATLFSLGGVTVILTTLLTFLPDILAYINEEAAKSSKSIRDFNEALVSATAATADERTELDALLVVARDETKSRVERNAAIERANEILPDQIGHLTNENILTAEADVLIAEYTEKLRTNAVAKAYLSQITALHSKLLAVERSLIEDNVDWTDKLSAAWYSGLSIQRYNILIQQAGINNKNASIKATKEEIDATINGLNAKLKSGEATLNLDAILEKMAAEAERKRKQREKDRKKDENAGPTEMQKFLFEQLKMKAEYYDNLLKKDKEYQDAVRKGFEIAEEDYDDFLKEQIELGLRYGEQQKASKEKERREYEQAEDAWDKQQLKKKEDVAKLAYEFARQAADSIISLQNARIDEDKNRIQEQIDLLDKQTQAQIDAVAKSVASEEEKAAKIAVIQAQAQAKKEEFEKKQRSLDQQKAINDKKKAIFDIILNTARAVAGFLGEQKNIPAAILAGAIGAAQLATVLATPIPKFAKGTDSSPEGLAYVGERGREMVVSPSGKLMLTPDSATLTYLERGSKVIPNHKLNGMALDGLAGITRYATQTSDYKLLAKATSESADKITKAIKNQPVTTITEGGLYREHLKAAKLANYYKNRLK